MLDDLPVDRVEIDFTFVLAGARLDGPQPLHDFGGVLQHLLLGGERPSGAAANLLRELAKHDRDDGSDDQGDDDDLPVVDDGHDQRREALGDLGHGLAQQCIQPLLQRSRIAHKTGDVLGGPLGDHATQRQPDDLSEQFGAEIRDGPGRQGLTEVLMHEIAHRPHHGQARDEHQDQHDTIEPIAGQQIDEPLGKLEPMPLRVEVDGEFGQPRPGVGVHDLGQHRSKAQQADTQPEGRDQGE